MDHNSIDQSVEVIGANNKIRHIGLARAAHQFSDNEESFAKEPLAGLITYLKSQVGNKFNKEMVPKAIPLLTNQMSISVADAKNAVSAFSIGIYWDANPNENFFASEAMKMIPEVLKEQGYKVKSVSISEINMEECKDRVGFQIHAHSINDFLKAYNALMAELVKYCGTQLPLDTVQINPAAFSADRPLA